MADIDFFGFTGENTVGDVREYFKKHPDDLKQCANQLTDTNVYYRRIYCLLFTIMLDKERNELFKKYTKECVSKSFYEGIPQNIQQELKDNILQTDLEETLLSDLQTSVFKENANKGSETSYVYFTRALSYNQKIGASKESVRFAKNIIPLRKSNKRLHNIKSEIEKIEKPRRQFVFTGAPGTGKTYGVTEFAKAYITANGGDTEKRDTEKQYKFVQFHPSFDYTDFVEGLKPAVIGHKKDGEPVTSFVRMDGVFKKFCRKAAADKNNLYFFIIDEINRADLSRVFGELMYCLEESYRGKRYRIDTQYQNLPTYEYVEANGKKIAKETEDDVFAEGFYIPENVVIIGTMNDIDRSVETFDFALRRRFRWINITAKESMKILEERLDGIYKHDDKNNELKKRIEALNEKIGNDPKLGEAFQLGQSYFTKIDKYMNDSNKDNPLEDYFADELKPILEEYVRGWKKTDAETFVNDCQTAFAPQPPTSNKGSN